MLVTPFKDINNHEFDIKNIKKRFLSINRERLRRTQNALRWKQRDFLDILPVLFHINHAMLPGYISKETPAGIPMYTPPKKSIEAIKRNSKSFTYKRRAMRTYDIHSIFIMGSVGTIAHSEKSDFDIWICHEPSLNANQLSELKAKCGAIEAWSESIGLEVHFFLMNADQFRSGEVHELSSESSGTTQHHLLLEEFYRTSLLVAGRYPIWWLVPPGMEAEYKDVVDRLVKRRFVSDNEVIDFGGLSEIPAEEFFGAALWQVYKGIDSPYKSVLKILLMESYASEYPNTQLLALHYKQMVYDGVIELDSLDPYTILVSKLENYLRERNEPDRLELVRRCFYFKVNIALSKIKPNKDSWQLQRLNEFVSLWGWRANILETLDDRENWKIHRVLNERKILVDELTHSYLFLSNFARNNTSLSRISQKDLNILGRKLYAAFERKAGKIELVNRGISANVVERRLTVQQALAKNGEETWTLLNEPDESKDKSDKAPVVVKRGRSAAELFAWCHFNRLINPGTVITLDTKDSILNIKEVKSILESLEKQFPGGKFPEAQIDDLEKPPRITSACVFCNVGLDPLPNHSRRGTDIVSDRTDVLNYSGFGFNLALSFDLIIATSWHELLTYRYSGIDGLMNCLCQYLRWHKNTPEINSVNLVAHSFSSSHSNAIAKRIEQVFNDVCQAFYKGNRLNVLRYIIEVQQAFFILYVDNDSFQFARADTEQDLFVKLSEPQSGYNPICTDRFALLKSILPSVLPKNKAGMIQLFYEKVGNNANIYLLDEHGSLFYQFLPFHDDHALLNQYNLFIDSILSRQAYAVESDAPNAGLQNIEFCRVTRVAACKCAFERKLMNADKLRRRYFHVQVIGNVVEQKTVFTIYCEDKEFSSFDHGKNLFQAVAKYVFSRRSSGIKYPIYITDLDLAPALLGERAEGTLHIVEYLSYKKRIEEKLNQELELL